MQSLHLNIALGIPQLFNPKKLSATDGWLLLSYYQTRLQLLATPNGLFLSVLSIATLRSPLALLFSLSMWTVGGLVLLPVSIGLYGELKYMTVNLAAVLKMQNFHYYEPEFFSLPDPDYPITHPLRPQEKEQRG